MSVSSTRRRNLPSHTLLRSFECAARQQSFTLAARELNLTQSAISRQVKELEQVVGTDLFRRVGRRVVLTRAGRNLAADLAVDLENIRQTLSRAIASGAQGASLRIAVLPTFASRWLVPHLSDFARKHPGIAINLATRLEPFDLTREQFDIAIHFGTDNWPDTKMARIFEEEMVAVCSPEFQTRHGIRDETGLSGVPLLHLETRSTAWSDWFDDTKTDRKSAQSGMHFDQFSMLISGAVCALGAALIPTYLIENELAKGSLIRISDKSLKTKNGYFVVTPAGNSRSGVKEFTDWIRTAAA